MTVEISRDLVVSRLGAVRYDRFLFYLMGPYTSFDFASVLDQQDRAAIEASGLPETVARLIRDDDGIDDAMALLRRVQGALRTDPGLNAYLAVDVDVGLDEIDAVTQSIEFARHSNATAFVVPFLGQNFGVGEETGSVLENLAETHGDRLLFVHEDDVASAMIGAADVRWDLRIETYESEGELVGKLRRFAAGVMHRERRGDLEHLR